jgi:hypothetical protein
LLAGSGVEQQQQLTKTVFKERKQKEGENISPFACR